MPEWYKKWHGLLNKCKKISRCNSIWLWHEETLAKMQARVRKLKKEVIVGQNK